MKNKLEKLLREYKHIQSDSSLIYDSGVVGDYQNGFEEGKYQALDKVIKDLKRVLESNEQKIIKNTKNKIGEKKFMNCGEECEIVEYKKYDDITIKFLKTGELIKSTYNNFKKGEIKSHFVPTVYGVGVVGLEKIVDEEGKQLKPYDSWHDMLIRCYDKKLQDKNPTYKDCKVCDEWLYYPNFKKWFKENYYKIDNQRMALDKDILIKGNKMYSPETCIFVPQNINVLFTNRRLDRGNLPIGVAWHKASGKYQANCKILDINTKKYKHKHLGLYNTIEKAFDSYKIAKEDNIKNVADYYKDRIPEKLYNAMYMYEIHIDD